MRTIAILLAAGLAAACSPEPKHRDFGAQAVSMAKYESATAAAAAADPAMDAMASASAPRVGSPAPATAAPMLAYSYTYGVETPAAKVRPLMSTHERACVQAGREVCQVIGSSTNSRGPDDVSAQLELRAAPAWIAQFRRGLADQTRKAGGRITGDTTVSEDLTRQIIDTAAALRAKTALRDRMQGLLESHPGKLSDLLDVERELARVQGEIDATTSELAVMRARVATSALTISYQSEGVLAPQGVAAPLKQALLDFLGILFFTLAAMVRLVAWLLPWLLVGGLLIWLFRRKLRHVRWPRRRKEKPSPAPE